VRRRSYLWTDQTKRPEEKPWLLTLHKRSFADMLYDTTWFFPGFVPNFVILLFDIFMFHWLYIITLISLALITLMIPALQVYPSAFVISRYKVRAWLIHMENDYRIKKDLPVVFMEKIS